jgi:phospholipid/cholesterol/gamma-HCH transport system substrate-binding protein
VKRLLVTGVAAALLSGCSMSPYDVPLPGGADVGDDPYTVTVQFRDVLDLVPQSGVRVDEVPVGRVSDVRLDGWTAEVDVTLNRDVKLPDNARATIRQTSLLGEKFVSLEAPEKGAEGELGDGDTIPLSQTGRNPEVEEVLSAASLLLNGSGLEKTQTIVRELNRALDGNEAEVKRLLTSAGDLAARLDDNKERILTTLEKVDRLARRTQQQEKAITGALDQVPDALRVVDGQREALVTLLDGLERLSEVGTRVVKASKDDVLADLEALRPTLTNLGTAADDLVTSFQALLTFPFTDAVVGKTLEEAKAYEPGDYTNLSMRLDLNADTLAQVLDLEGLLDAVTGPLRGEPGAAGEPLDDLLGLVRGYVPEQADGTPGAPSPVVPQPSTRPTPAPSTAPTPGQGDQGGATEPEEPRNWFCGLFRLCRPAAASAAAPTALSVPAGVPRTDLAAALLDPVVRR